MGNQIFSNFAKTTIITPITAASTQLSVALTMGGLFRAPVTPQFQVLVLTDHLEYEVVKLVSRNSDTLTVIRGQESTVARSWSAGTQIVAWNTAGTMDELLQKSDYLPSVNIMNYRLFR